MRECHYDILGIGRQATDDEIKKAYRSLALKHHPDKNRDNLEESQATFILVQEAYETLSDPNERAWYDSHRSQILRGGDDPFREPTSEDDPSAARINIYRWFRKDCFNGFSETTDGCGTTDCFYTVYRRVFDIIVEEELKHSQDINHADYSFIRNAPSFGTSTTNYTDVLSFYRFWNNFSTQRSFNFADKWNINDAPNRAIRRQVEAENKLYRSSARKEFNSSVRALTTWMKKRDLRVIAGNAAIAEKARDQPNYAEEMRQKAIVLEQQRRQNKIRAHQEEIERWKMLKEAKKQAAKESGQVFIDDSDSESNVSVNSNTYPGSSSKAKQDEINGSNKNQKYSGHIAFVCEPCKKTFRSDAQFKAHEKSRKHEKALQDLLRQIQIEEDIDQLDSSDTHSDTSSISKLEVNEESSCNESVSKYDSDRSIESMKLTHVRTLSNSSGSEASFDNSEDNIEDMMYRVKQMRLGRAAAQTSTLLETEDEDDDTLHEKEETTKPNIIYYPKKKKKKRATHIKANICATTVVDTSSESESKQYSSQKKKLNRRQQFKDSSVFVCDVCIEEFTSRNKLFQHINATGHAVVKDMSKKQKKKMK